MFSTGRVSGVSVCFFIIKNDSLFLVVFSCIGVIGYLCIVFLCFMAGLYIHIPFCRSRCFYCDFFSSTSLGLRGVYVDALCNELIARRDFIGGGAFDSVYFGGGLLLCCVRMISSVFLMWWVSFMVFLLMQRLL